MSNLIEATNQLSGRKQELRDRIHELVAEFQLETGLQIVSISLITAPTYGIKKDALIGIEITTQL